MSRKKCLLRKNILTSGQLRGKKAGISEVSIAKKTYSSLYGRKILIKRFVFFLTQVGADIPVNWSSNALALVRDAVIEAYNKMGITLEVDERLQKIFITGLSTSDPGGTVS